MLLEQSGFSWGYGDGEQTHLGTILRASTSWPSLQLLIHRMVNFFLAIRTMNV
jgi:hypothetical protein